MKKSSTLIVVVGPTAVGKTDFCVQLAKRLKTVIISADSRQFYRGMVIGTAQPTKEEMQGVTHHMIGFLDFIRDYNAGQFEKDVLELLDQLFQQHDYVVMAGGSGLYIKAVCNGLAPMPKISPDLRNDLNSRLLKNGLQELLRELHKLDPEYTKACDIINPRRVLRALEVCLQSGQPYSKLRNKKLDIDRPFRIHKIGLGRPRDTLYARINQRVDAMMNRGLLEEAKKFYEYRHLNALQTIGYQEMFSYFDGVYSLNEAIECLKLSTRRYAKRQITWFKRDPEIIWQGLF